jgi:hypothetical protein
MTAGRVILSVSPFACDHQSVQAGAAACSCRVALANNLSEALLRLIELDIGVVVCERELLPGTWLDVLQRLQERPSPPLLIVTSRLADDRFWAEALNLGLGTWWSSLLLRSRSHARSNRPGVTGISSTRGLSMLAQVVRPSSE